MKVRVTEGKFGTVGAVASAFVFGFLPLIADKIKKSEDNSGRKSKHSTQLRASPNNTLCSKDQSRQRSALDPHVA
ncbi:hypothetical protein [Paenibacillus sp. sgz500992]|uniref:hypothetical protein n=1 Tax=Paenibacillus sp. sgz500992 TaxID=3242476 RepID=UPI0036D3CDE6